MKKINIYILLIAFLLMTAQVFGQQTLTLEKSKQLALQNNAKSKNSKLEVRAAKQIRKTALTHYFPTISAGGMMYEAQKPLMEMDIEGGNLPVYNGNPATLFSATQFAYFPGFSMGLLEKGTIGYVNIIQPVFTGGRIINGNKLAALNVKAKQDQKSLAEDEITLKTEELFWQIVSLDEKSLTIEKYEELLNSLLKQVDDAYNSGITMKNDLLKVKLKKSQVLVNKSKLENGKKLAKMAFCQHVDIPYDSLLTLDAELKITGSPQNYYIDKNQALTRRTEYALLQKSVRAEKLQTRMKIGEYLPQAGVGLSGQYLKFDKGEGRTLGLAFASVSVPISGWWGGTHEIKERKLKEKIAENNFKDNSELLLLQIEKAWQDLTTSYKEYLLCEESKSQAEENLKVEKDSYENGLVSISDLLEAQALQQETLDQLTEAKVRYIIEKTRYFQLTGR